MNNIQKEMLFKVCDGNISEIKSIEYHVTRVLEEGYDFVNIIPIEFHVPSNDLRKRHTEKMTSDEKAIAANDFIGSIATFGLLNNLVGHRDPEREGMIRIAAVHRNSDNEEANLSSWRFYILIAAHVYDFKGGVAAYSEQDYKLCYTTMKLALANFYRGIRGYRKALEKTGSWVISPNEEIKYITVLNDTFKDALVKPVIH